MKKIIILENESDKYGKTIEWKNQIEVAKAYQNRLNEDGNDYIVIPLMNGLKMKTIELDTNGLDIYIEELQEVKKRLGE